ncbi:MAG: hypothetical protein NT150_07005 [Bacteroidetes bacterium]|nr:hypothetical protein [Bacteroidota bacterium]
MKKIGFLFVLGVVYATTLMAEDNVIRWSDIIKSNNTADGFFQKIVGDNSKYIYALFSNYSAENNGYGVSFKKYKIIMFRKEDMKRSNAVSLKGFGLENEIHVKIKKMYLVDAYIDEGSMYVLWVLPNKSILEYFVERFSSQNLNRVVELRKIYERTSANFSSSSGAFQGYNTFKACINSKGEGRLFLINCFEDIKRNINKMEIVSIKKNLESTTFEKIEFPAPLLNNYLYVSESTSFEAGDDENLYFKYQVCPFSNYKKLNYGFGVIDTNGIMRYRLVDIDKEALSVNIKIENKQIKVFGTYKNSASEKGFEEFGVYCYTVAKDNFSAKSAIKLSIVPSELFDVQSKWKLNAFSIREEQAIFSRDSSIIFVMSYTGLRGHYDVGSPRFLLVVKMNFSGQLEWANVHDLKISEADPFWRNELYVIEQKSEIKIVFTGRNMNELDEFDFSKYIDVIFFAKESGVISTQFIDLDKEENIISSPIKVRRFRFYTNNEIFRNDHGLYLLSEPNNDFMIGKLIMN